MFRFKSDALGNAKGFSFNITTEGNEVYIYHDTLQSVMNYVQTPSLLFLNQAWRRYQECCNGQGVRLLVVQKLSLNL